MSAGRPSAGFGVAAAEERREAGRHFFLRLAPVAGLQPERRRPLAADVAHGHRRRRRFRPARLHRGQLRLQLLVAFLLLAGQLRLHILGRAVHLLLRHPRDDFLIRSALLRRRLLGLADLGAELHQGVLPRLLALAGDQGIHLFADVLRRFFPGGEPGLVVLALRAVQGRRVVARPHRGEERLEAVVVRLWDGVEFVVVAAGAAERHAEEGQSRRVGDVVEDFLTALLQVGGVVFVGPQAEKPGGDHGIRLVRFQLVAGQLLADESVVGQVGVEAADDVIAVAVRFRPQVVGLEAVGLGVAHQIEPVGRHALAVVRAGQQPIDHLFVGVGRSVLEKGVLFVEGRRQAGQVEGDAAQQAQLLGGRRWFHPGGILAREDEGVDGVDAPGLVVDGRQVRPPRRLEQGRRSGRGPAGEGQEEQPDQGRQDSSAGHRTHSFSRNARRAGSWIVKHSGRPGKEIGKEFETRLSQQGEQRRGVGRFPCGAGQAFGDW